MKISALAFTATIMTLALSPNALAQDAKAGETVFKKCRVCHQVGDKAKNSVGPVLNGIVGQPAGTVPNYNYTDANKKSGLTWDEATLTEYLRDPRKKVPGTKMTFAGLTSADDIVTVIAYLKTLPARAN